MVSPEVAEFLRTTPIVKWQQQKMQLTLEDVNAAARAKGLRFEHVEAVNSDDFVVFGKDGTQLRRGRLSAIRFFIERR